MRKSYSVKRKIASNEKKYQKWGKDTWPGTGDCEVHTKELMVQGFLGLHNGRTTTNHRAMDMITNM